MKKKMSEKQYKYDERKYEKYKPQYEGEQNELPKAKLSGCMGKKRK